MGVGVVLFFEFESKEVVKKLVENVLFLVFVVSFGVVELILFYLVMMFYVVMFKEECEKCGIIDGLFCLSVGVEYVDDLEYDFE